MDRFALVVLLLTLVAVSVLTPHAGAAGPTEIAAKSDGRTAWWREARFGMFIHWDMSSIAGTEISWSRKGSKPLDVTGDPAGYVEDPDYDHLYERFNPINFDAGRWVRIAKDAGMKYIVITAKHHGGFCMWDTSYTDYSIMHAPFKRDVIKELSDACHKAGLRFGIYYSPRDWHHPDYGVGDDSRYLDYMKGQLTELLTRYGTVDVMWFDSFGHGDSNSYWHADEVLALVKRLQPRAVINNRCNSFANSTPDLQGDFDTPEQTLGSFRNDRLWESCICVVDAPGGGWSYRTDGKVKPFSDCLKTLVGCATGDGNLLLDVGPNADGEIPAEQTERLGEIGRWIGSHGQSIYGTRGGPYHNGAWGGATYRKDTIYLHVARWNADRLVLPNLKAHVLKSEVVGNPAANGCLQVVQSGGTLEVSLPAGQQHAIDTVVALHLDAPAENELNNGRAIEVSDAAR